MKIFLRASLCLLTGALACTVAAARTIEFETTEVTAADVALSPDGKQIAFNCAPEGKYDQYGICMINTDGSGFHTLTNNQFADLHPDW